MHDFLDEERNWLGEAFLYWAEGSLEVGQILFLCPGANAELPTMKMAAQSWHHLANQLNDDVVVSAVYAVHRVDELDSEPRIWAEVVSRALANMDRYWPAIAEALAKFGFDDFEVKKLAARLESEWVEMDTRGKGSTAHSLIQNRCQSAIGLLRAAQLWKHENRPRAESRTEKPKKNRAVLPRDDAPRKLALEIAREPIGSDRSMREIALEFTRGNAADADSLLRTIRNYPQLKSLIKQRRGN